MGVIAAPIQQASMHMKSGDENKGGARPVETDLTQAARLARLRAPQTLPTNCEHARVLGEIVMGPTLPLHEKSSETAGGNVAHWCRFRSIGIETCMPDSFRAISASTKRNSSPSARNPRPFPSGAALFTCSSQKPTLPNQQKLQSGPRGSPLLSEPAAASPSAGSMRGGPTLWAFAGVAWLVASLLFVVCSTAVSFFSLPRAWAVAWLVVEAVSLLVPLDLAPPRWAARFLRFSVAELRGYFPITLTYEDKDAFKQQRPFVIGD